MILVSFYHQERFWGQLACIDTYRKLLFLHARWLDVEIGRFLSPDTIIPNPANPQSLNRYSYALENPLRYTDPTGHYGEDVHYGLTYHLTRHEALGALRRVFSEELAQALAQSLADRVASADQGVDEVPFYNADFSLWPGSPHWWSHAEAVEAIADAGVNPEEFGRAMHGSQDYYSHRARGYTVPGDPTGLMAPLGWLGALAYLEDCVRYGEEFDLSTFPMSFSDYGHGASFLYKLLGAVSNEAYADTYNPASDELDRLMRDASEDAIQRFVEDYVEALYASLFSSMPIGVKIE